MRHTTDFDPQIVQLALHNPLVYQYMNLYLRGDVTREQMLTECVLQLAIVNKQQFDLLVNEVQHRPPSVDRRLLP